MRNILITAIRRDKAAESSGLKWCPFYETPYDVSYIQTKVLH